MGPDLSMAIGVFIMRFVTVCGPSFFYVDVCVSRRVCDKCRAIFARVHGECISIMGGVRSWMSRCDVSWCAVRTPQDTVEIRVWWHNIYGVGL